MPMSRFDRVNKAFRHTYSSNRLTSSQPLHRQARLTSETETEPSSDPRILIQTKQPLETLQKLSDVLRLF